MFVRTASGRDLAAVRTLLVETWHDSCDSIYGAARVTEITEAWHSLAALRQLLDRPHSEFLVADDGTAIAGAAFASALDGGKTVMLHQLYVRPGRQGNGIGAMLLDEISSCFPDAGKVRAEVDQANDSALRFFQAQGFARTGSRDGDGLMQDMTLAVLERPILWVE